MACKVMKKVLGYEICIFEKEGTLYYNDYVILVRRAGFTEIFNLEYLQHEIGDKISNQIKREQIYAYITDNKEEFMDVIKNQTFI